MTKALGAGPAGPGAPLLPSRPPPAGQVSARPPPAAPAAGARWRGKLGGVLIVVAVVLGIALGRAVLSDQSEESQVRDAIAEVEGSDFDDDVDDDLAAFALAVGDCFDDGSSGTAASEVVDVQVEEVPCSSPHDAEVYALVTHPAPSGESYPGDDAMIQFADEQCAATFESFVGTPRDLSSLDIYFTFPIDVAFQRLDERQIVCSVYALDLSKLTGSMAGSRR